MPEPHPAAQFADLRQQHEVAQLGMWVFLATEVLFFGGLLLALRVYRFGYPAGLCRGRAPHQDRHRHDQHRGPADQQLRWSPGRSRPPRSDEGALAAILLCVAALLGAVFLGLKGVEYRDEYREHLVPGGELRISAARDAGGAELFFVFYFVATGLHAVHLRSASSCWP